MKTSIVIPVHNALSYTKQCLGAIRAFLPKKSYEIIVIDNASNDETGEWLKEQTDIKIIVNAENRGTAAAYNQGIHISVGEEVLLLHNDAVLIPGVLEKMRARLWADGEIGAVGPVTNRASYIYQQVEAGSYADMEGLLHFSEQITERERDIPWQETLFLEDFCLLLKREAAETCGDFDEQYDLRYLEDLDYSFRLQQKGYRLGIVRDAYVHHERGSFSKNGMDGMAYYSANHARFVKKWGFRPEYSASVRTDLLQFIDFAKADLAILDVGCSCGGNLMRIRSLRSDARLYGVELNEKAASIANCFGKVLPMNIEKLDSASWKGAFDYIIMGDVLEHLYDPWTTAKNMKELLKPAGILLASIPNVAHISIIEGLLQGKWQYADSGLLDRTHLRFFTKQSFLDMMEAAGFNNELVGGSQVRQTTAQQQLLSKLQSLDIVNACKEDRKVFQWYVIAKNEV